MAEIVIEGLEEFKAKLVRMGNAARGRIAKEAVDEGAAVIQFHAQLNARNIFSKNQRGQLRNSIIPVSYQTDTGAEAKVGPGVIYGRIQELGGDIYPKPGGYLKFQIDGQWRTIKYGSKVRDHVHLPSRPYLAPAVEDHAAEISDVMAESIRDSLEEFAV